MLLALFFAWLVAAKTMYAQIMGGAVPASLGEFSHQVLTTSAGWQLIVVGNAVGFVFAALALIISVVSFPMLVDRNVGAATAVRTSVRAVAADPLTMAASGLFGVAALIVGSLPLFFGLAVVFRCLATRHGISIAGS